MSVGIGLGLNRFASRGLVSSGSGLPDEIANLDNVINYTDFTDASAYVFSSGTLVESITRGAGTVDLAQAVTGEQPTYESTAVGGIGGCQLNNTDENLFLDMGGGLSSGGTIIVAYQDPGASDGNDTTFALGSSTAVVALSRVFQTGDQAISLNRNEAGDPVSLINLSGSTAFTVILAIRINSSSDMDIYLNTINPIIDINPDDNWGSRDHFYVGDPADANVGTVFLKSLVTSDAMSDAEIAAVINAWATEFSVTLTTSGYDVGADGSVNSSSTPTLATGPTWTEDSGTGYTTTSGQSRVVYMGSNRFAVLEAGSLYMLTWTPGSGFTTTGSSFATGAPNTAMLGVIYDNTVVIMNATANTLQCYRFHSNEWFAVGNSLAVTGTNYDAMCCLAPKSLAQITGGILEKVDWDGHTLAVDGTGLNIASTTGQLTAMSATRVAVLDPNGDDIQAYDWSSGWSTVGNAYSVTAYTGSYGIISLSSSRVVYQTSGNGVQALDFDGTDFTTAGDEDAFSSLFGSWPRVLTRVSDTQIGAFSFTGKTIQVLEAATV